MAHGRKYLSFDKLLARVIGMILSQMRELEDGLFVWDPREEWSLPYEKRTDLPSQTEERVLSPLVKLGFIKSVRASRFSRFSASGRPHYGRRVYIVCNEPELRKLQKMPPAKTWFDFMVWVKIRQLSEREIENLRR